MGVSRAITSRPDGTEEGNFVGKFLDTYKVMN
jgi:hypothetical protein